MPFTMKDDSNGIKYEILWGKDSKGNPGSPPLLAQVNAAPGKPTWTEDSNGAIGVLTVAPDGMSAVLAPGAALGVVNVACAIPASSDGVFSAATLTDTVTVVGDEASSASLAGTPL